jgi:perosamine synthetase
MGARRLRIAEPQIGREEREAVDRVLRSGQLSQGPEVEAFEAELAANLAGTRSAVAVSSGTAALELALEVLDVGHGDEIVTTPFTFAAPINAALRAGATVRFADIGADFNLDPVAARAAVTVRTKLLLPVHLYGLPADVDALSELNHPILEDAAQAHLATLGGKRTGGLGIAACFSFYASKNMTTGEGGAVTTNDPDIAERVQIIRNQGMRGPYDYAEVGTNLRMTEIAAALGRVQLRALPQRTAARQRVAGLLRDALGGVEGVVMPSVPEGRTHVWHQFTVRLLSVDRTEVAAKLAAEGIETRVYYPQAIPDAGPYRDHPGVDASLPLDRAREAARTALSLPCHPGVTESDIQRTSETLARAVASVKVARS